MAIDDNKTFKLIFGYCSLCCAYIKRQLGTDTAFLNTIHRKKD